MHRALTRAQHRSVRRPASQPFAFHKFLLKNDFATRDSMTTINHARQFISINERVLPQVTHTMKTSITKQRLAKNEPAFATTLHLSDPFAYELAGTLGVEGIWLDMERRPFTLDSAARMMIAARAGGDTDVIVRVSRHEMQMVTRVLENGAQGIIYPRCNDADEAREVVHAAKFAPLGERGCDGWGRDAPFGQMPLEQYVKAANDNTLIVIQIETPEALENAESIAAVDGVGLWTRRRPWRRFVRLAMTRCDRDNRTARRGADAWIWRQMSRARRSRRLFADLCGANRRRCLRELLHVDCCRRVHLRVVRQPRSSPRRRPCWTVQRRHAPLLGWRA